MSWLLKLLEGFGAAEAAPAPPPRPQMPDFRLPKPPTQMGRVPIQDERDVPPTQSFAGWYPEEHIRNTIRGAGEAGIDPELFLSMALQEGYWKAPPGAVSDRDMADLGRHFRETATYANAAGVTELPRLIQSYNGLGSPAAEFEQQGADTAYGGIPVRELPRNFYGNRVLDLRDNVVRKSPALKGLMETTRYQPSLQPLDMNQIDALSKDLDRRRRRPQVSEILQNPDGGV